MKFITFVILVIGYCIVVFNSIYELYNAITSFYVLLSFLVEIAGVVGYLAYNKDLMKELLL